MVAPTKFTLLVDSINVEGIVIVFQRWDFISAGGILNVRLTLVFRI